MERRWLRRLFAREPTYASGETGDATVTIAPNGGKRR
jgi:hypothetical protein